MEDMITGYYGDNVELVEWWQDDGHHSELADLNDPLAILLAEEEQNEQ